MDKFRNWCELIKTQSIHLAENLKMETELMLKYPESAVQ